MKGQMESISSQQTKSYEFSRHKDFWPTTMVRKTIGKYTDMEGCNDDDKTWGLMQATQDVFQAASASQRRIWCYENISKCYSRDSKHYENNSTCYENDLVLSDNNSKCYAKDSGH